MNILDTSDNQVPRVLAQELRHQWSQWGKDKSVIGRRGHSLTQEAGSVMCGNVELWKRKPPDGKERRSRRSRDMNDY